MRALSILFLLLLTGCSSAPDKERYDIIDDMAPENSPTLAHIEDAQPRYEAKSLAGNKNYTLRGQEYKIVTDKKDFTQEGHASWYGKKFHGHKTSNGEIYDMYSMTAAHKTLPLPSYVKVTNQKNGKTAIVRINDRGPFHEGRIIDLSMAAAAKLDLIKDGTAPVKIELIPIEKPASPDEWQTANPYYYYVQLAAISNEKKARLIANKLEKTFATSVDLKKAGSVAIYRVRLGPFIDRDEAIALRDKAKANNYPKAFITTTQREWEQK